MSDQYLPPRECKDANLLNSFTPVAASLPSITLRFLSKPHFENFAYGTLTSFFCHLTKFQMNP